MVEHRLNRNTHQPVFKFGVLRRLHHVSSSKFLSDAGVHSVTERQAPAVNVGLEWNPQRIEDTRVSTEDARVSIYGHEIDCYGFSGPHGDTRFQLKVLRGPSHGDRAGGK